MKSKSQDALPERVPFTAIPTGETPSISRWAQHAVWTDRMLTTLLEDKVKGDKVKGDKVKGDKVKGGKWHALIDKVYGPLNLFASSLQVTSKKKSAGVDGQSCEDFAEHRSEETCQLAEELKAQTYRPKPVLRVDIPKPGRPNQTRPLGVPTVRDRVVQRAVLNVIEPILDHPIPPAELRFSSWCWCSRRVACC